MLARRDPPAHRPPLLDAERIDLRVLAPAAFYAAFDLTGFERSIDRGVDALGCRYSVALSFGFDVLPPCLAASPLPPGPALLDALDGRHQLPDKPSMADLFLPGVPAAHVLRRLEAAGGNEVASGKLASPESSAALAVNAFGWFIERPELFPPLPGTEHAGPAERVEVEYCARFPWTDGRHPWLDAAVLTATHLIGVESKRYEPFRDAKSVAFSAAYDRPVWGDNMRRYGAVRDALRSGELRFEHLDAAQLVKHAYGLVTEGRRLGRRPVLFYLFAEPAARAGTAIPAEAVAHHRCEITAFASAVAGDEVEFASASYREWFDAWRGNAGRAEHMAALRRMFMP